MKREIAKTIAHHEVCPNSKMAVLQLSENLNLNRITDLKNFFDELLHNGTSKFIVDMSKVPFLYSSVLGVMIGTAKKSKSLKGGMKFYSTSPGLESVLRSAGFLNQLALYPSREEAFKLH
ncbi:STAS domain-containing protein [bacterium]|jgi:anti-anti-sigma factor|nr:STAS domain-containing protein [bacterium]